MSTFQLSLVSPEKLLFTGPVYKPIRVSPVPTTAF